MDRFRFKKWAVFVLCGLFYFVAWGYELNLPVGGGGPKVVYLPKGLSLWEIATRLKEEGLIRSPVFFVWEARLLGMSHRIKAGEYRLSPYSTSLEILRVLTSGKVLLHRVTIPEGYNLWQIAALLDRAGLASEAAFLQAARNPVLLRCLSIPGPTAEGYLFPETYTLSKGLPPEAIITLMVRQFWQVWKDFAPRARELGVGVREVVILASIVEKEARVPEERPLIAGIFWNRLKRGMLLQADPTVRYALKKFEGPLTRADLRVPSPYNTYVHPGLPPGPICNPGRASLRAVLYPIHTDYLYFVAKGDGTHYFSRTLKEHLRAVKRFRHHP